MFEMKMDRELYEKLKWYEDNLDDAYTNGYQIRHNTLAMKSGSAYYKLLRSLVDMREIELIP